ncbi:MAG: alanine--tRNA ligase [bacterium]|nr:alanine--tRNA ligase [bacterium]
MKSREIRQKFLDFFKDKGHEIVPSAPMVIQNDPTLMFTNAGMNQFKDYFLGNKESKYPRVADTQKCLRVSGKHNDLEEVGMDTYHHTMFEMLGNWSFGDYFKEEAIKWAWELLTEVYGLPKDRMYASVFGGDEGDKLEVDTEAYNFWKDIVGEDKIIYGSKKDNFWEMGDTGPCGPCSEIHIDLRPESEIAKVPGKDLVNMDHPQVVEIWNLVFMQFNRNADKSLQPLPAQHVDTGMGFERLAMAIQGKQSNYETDVFTEQIAILEKAANVVYGKDEKVDIALRVIVDHIRAISFAVADGQLPSNVKAGYVIRRILRRAVRYGYTFLGFKEPFMNELVPALAEQFSGVFPELEAQQDFIKKVVYEEEVSFLKTLENGLKRMEAIKQEASGKEISGKVAFELYDTYGFPFDLTQLIASESGFTVNEDQFKQEMNVQKERSKSAGKISAGDWTVVKEIEQCEFLGYEQLESNSFISRYRKVSEKGKDQYQIVLDQTPFYAESGGQVGDTGYIEYNGVKTSILDTKKENDLIVHYVKDLPEQLNVEFKSVVSRRKRLLTENNHSATHLLHAALKQVLGDHVQQKGSLVNDKILRFDFSHFSKMSDEEIQQVEDIVNERVRQNIELDEKRNVPIAKAQEMGATALFGEKYGEFVRVITFDPSYSIELCGGTHVPATGTIGLFKIKTETSVAAGVRRIEAVTAEVAETYVRKELNVVNEIREALKNPKDLTKAIEALIKERSDLQKQVEKLNAEKAGNVKQDLLDQFIEINDINLLITQAEFPDADSLKKISFELKNELNNLIMIVAADINGKPMISVMVSESLLSSYDIHAGNLVKELAREIKGGGGGQPFYATAGGKDVSGLPNAVQKAKEFAENLLTVKL